jgi:hypothetical protein
MRSGHSATWSSALLGLGGRLGEERDEPGGTDHAALSAGHKSLARRFLFTLETIRRANGTGNNVARPGDTGRRSDRRLIRGIDWSIAAGC